MSKKFWVKEQMLNDLNYMIKESGIKRMPTRSEVDKFYGNTRLSNAISKKSAWYSIAKELGLSLKDCDTNFGVMFERIAENELIYMGYEVEKTTQNHPYDLLINGAVKVDVKVSKMYKGKNGNFYSFNLEKRMATCDIYLLYMASEKNEIIDRLIVPSKFVMKQTQISVGEKTSKYRKYSEKWEYLDYFVEFNEGLE